MKKAPKGIKRKGYYTGGDITPEEQKNGVYIRNGVKYDQTGAPVMESPDMSTGYSSQSTLSTNTLPLTNGTEFKTNGDLINASAKSEIPPTQESGKDGQPKQKGGGGAKLGASLGWMQWANQGKDFAKNQVDYEEVTDPTTGETFKKPKTYRGAVVDSTATPYHEKVVKSAKEGDFSSIGSIAAGPMGEATYNAMYGKKKQDEEWAKNINKIEQNKERVANAGNTQEAIDARNRGETSYNVQNKYRRDPSTIIPEREDSKIEKLGNKLKPVLQPFAKGGEIKGKGTGTSDSINAEVEEGSFVVPEKMAHVGKMIKETLLKKKTGTANLHQKKNAVPVKLSNGEILFTKEEKDEIEKEMGEEMLEALAPEAEENEEGMAKGGELSASKARKILHDKQVNGKPLTDKQRRYMGWVAGGSKMAGGEVNEYAKGTPKDGVTKIGDKKPNTETKKTTPKKTYKSKPFVPQETIPSKNINGLFQEAINKEAEKSLSVASNKIDSTPLVDTKKPEPVAKTGFWDKVGSVNTDGLGSAIANYGLAAYQIKKGQEGLKGTRPIDKIDPTFQSNVDTAQANAKFGFTPEQQFLLDQQNQQLLNADRFAARNYSGGSGGNAYNMERNASNNSFMRSLQNASANTELQQSKQQFAAQTALQKANMSRNIFEDSLNAFQQKQAASGQLLGAGISNVMDTNRFANYMKLRNQENEFKNQYL